MDRHPAHHSASVSIFEGFLGTKGDCDHLFAVGGHGGATVGILGKVDDPEVDLRFDPSGAGSNTVTYGEPYIGRAMRSMFASL